VVPARDGARVRAGRLRHALRVVAVTALTAVVLGLTALAGLWFTTPDGDQAMPRVASMLAAEHAAPLTALPRGDRVTQALIATENSRYYDDVLGIDPPGAVKSVVFPLIGQGDQGGSTLEQQLAKLAFPDQAGGPLGKARVVTLAMKISTTYSKQDTLLMYLNAAYFGHGYYGLHDAALGYFHTDPAKLGWGQAAMLAGLVQAPSLYDPVVHLSAARARQAHVLDRLVATGVLTHAQADAAYAAPLHLVR
jgi:membrane peptidoglycan carboxypeptidase